MDDERFDHPTLGCFEHDIADEVWVVRGGANGRSFDLAVLGTDDHPGPSLAGLQRLTLAADDWQALLARAVQAIRTARVSRLAWTEGPPDSGWTLLALVSDPSGGLWLVLLEPASDVYSSWWAGFDGDSVVFEVRRGAAGASYDPHSARLV